MNPRTSRPAARQSALSPRLRRLEQTFAAEMADVPSTAATASQRALFYSLWDSGPTTRVTTGVTSYVSQLDPADQWMELLAQEPRLGDLLAAVRASLGEYGDAERDG